MSPLRRRDFLHVAGAGALAGCSAPPRIEGRPPSEYDVLVCGGGTSGLPAALAAARQGARVGILERYGFLGGNAAFSIMPCWHHLGDHHSGLLTGFARRVEAFGVGPAPLREGNHIEPEVVKILFLEMALERGVHLLLHRFIVGAVREGDRVAGAVTEGKSGRRTFAAKVFVDATGDGDLGARAGASCVKGADGEMQGMSLRFRVGPVDFDRFAGWAAGQPGELQLEGLVRAVRSGGGKGPGRAFYFGSRLDRLDDRFRDRYPDLPSGITYFNGSSIRPGELSINTTRAYGLDGTDPDDLTKGEIATRKQAWAVWRFLRENVPGSEGSVVLETTPQVRLRGPPDELELPADGELHQPEGPPGVILRPPRRPAAGGFAIHGVCARGARARVE